MNRCEFESTGTPGEYRCRRCGAVRASGNGSHKIHRWCGSIDLTMQQPPTADRGLGDTVARFVDRLTLGRGRELADAVARRLGRAGCGCDDRQERLNRAVPYGTAPYGASDRIAVEDPRPTLLLRMPHGLGDAVQMTVLLRHLRHYHPEWTIDVAAKIGAHTLFAGLCRRTYLIGDEPYLHGYTLARTLAWDEPWDGYVDSPATKAERCLREVFHLQPITELCHYQIQTGDAARQRARDYLESICRADVDCARSERVDKQFPVVLFHYQGNSATQQKTLDEELVTCLVRHTLERGLVPVVLDWDRRQTLTTIPGVQSPGAEHPLWMSTGSGDGETLAALIEASTAMLAIDSGPGHVAGATNTPTLVVWRGHHPLHYYSLSPNVRHAVPVDHRALLRGSRDEAVTFFERHYDHRLYADLRTALPRMFDELIDDALGGQDELTVDGDLWVRRRHQNADRTIVRDVYIDDCYGVDRLPWQPQYVVDVGAQIGAFACRVNRRMAQDGNIVCIEADRRNLPALERNVGHFAKIVPAACTYLPAPVRLRTSVFDDTDNTGGSSIDVAGEIVPQITLEEIMAAQELPWVDVLKLDCEGSELSILANSLSLDRVRLVIGEWHDRRQFLKLIAQQLDDWRMTILRDGPLGLFWLENPRFEITKHGVRQK